MISTPNRTEAELAACMSIKDTADFRIFRGWLERTLEECKTGFLRTGSEIEVRWLQGRSQALHDILSKLDETQAALERARRR